MTTLVVQAQGVPSSAGGADLPLSLTVYGPLGVLAMLGVLATIALFRTLSAERKAATAAAEQRAEALTKLHTETLSKLAEMQELHVGEMKDLIQQMNAQSKAETDRYRDIAQKAVDVVQSVGRKMKREVRNDDDQG